MTERTVFPWLATRWAERFVHPGLPQGLLITGPDGHGREAFVRALVASRLCSAPLPTGHACGRCQDCRWVDADQHPDLHVIDPARDAQASADDPADEAPEPATGRARRRSIAVDAIRHASDALRLSSAGRGMRLLVIEHADAMTLSAANALLKLLEEPPPAASIVLSTGAPARLPATVRSRCQRVTLPAASRDAAVAWLGAVIADRHEIDERLDRTGGAPVTARDLDADVIALQRALDAACARLDSAAAAVAAAATIPEDRLADAVDHLQRGVARRARDARGTRGALQRLLHADLALRRLRRLVDHPLNTRAFREELMLVMRAALAPAPGDRR
ncbi:MAG: hypothetical protein MUF30_11010 [Burkholderiales bacterium]|jgi:DNA polymerase-3 subunit delta'|nr:hypothetical protein [Burkholderiales bacterium]